MVAGNPTDLIIDVNGYFAPASLGASTLFPLTPCRIADTRTSQTFTGAFGPPSLTGYVGRDFPLATSPCLSSTPQAYSLNMTAVPPGPLSFLSTWPVGQSYPGVSTLNSPDGTTLANAAIVPAGTNGDIDVMAGNNTDLIIDINGTFQAPVAGSLKFYAVTPCRVADTRSSQGLHGGVRAAFLGGIFGPQFSDTRESLRNPGDGAGVRTEHDGSAARPAEFPVDVARGTAVSGRLDVELDSTGTLWRTRRLCAREQTGRSPWSPGTRRI